MTEPDAASRPRAVALFDFGGVVIKTPFELHDHAWRGPFDPAADELWRQSQEGVITERDYWRLRSTPYFPEADDPTAAFMLDLYARDEADIVRSEVVDLIEQLRAQGIRVAALTNDLAAFHPPEWIARMSVIGRFDPLIDLSHHGALKPSAEAFAYATGTLGAEPQDVVLLDDQAPNVAGAEHAGLTGVWFDVTDPAGSVERFRKVLGSI